MKTFLAYAGLVITVVAIILDVMGTAYGYMAKRNPKWSDKDDHGI